MLQIHHLNFSYASGEPSVFADFSMQLVESHICGLLGRNGAGKSTLLYLMCGLLRPDSGAIVFEGVDVKRRRPETLSDIFLVPEEFDLPDISLRSYVRLNAPFYPRFSEEMLRACLEEFDLPDDLRLGRLSMGQKKKVFMSFALAAGTRLLLMDEPTNGLDIPAKSLFRKVMARTMSEERTVVVSTHQVRDIDTLIDRVAVIDRSQLLLNSAMSDIAEHWCFDILPAGPLPADVLYAEPSLQGNQVIRPNTEQRDTPVNLELLFNALIHRPDLAGQFHLHAE